MGKPLEEVPKVTVKFAVATMPYEIETFGGLVSANPGDYVLDTHLGFDVLNPVAFRDTYRVVSEDNGEGVAELILPGEEGFLELEFER